MSISSMGISVTDTNPDTGAGTANGEDRVSYISSEEWPWTGWRRLLAKIIFYEWQWNRFFRKYMTSSAHETHWGYSFPEVWMPTIQQTDCLYPQIVSISVGLFFNLEKVLIWHPTSMCISPNCRTLWFLSYIMQRDNTPISLKIIILESGTQFLTKIQETYQCVEPNINGGVTRQIYHNKCLYSGLQNSSATESVTTAIILYPI